MQSLHGTRRAFLAALLFLAPFVSTARVAAAQANQAFVVIVNEESPLQTITREELSQLFLKKMTALPSGRQVLPVDLDGRNKVRAAFTSAVHKKSMTAIGHYWQQQIFNGKEVPPPAMQFEQDIEAFVRTTPDAIGYVSANRALGRGVRVLRVDLDGDVATNQGGR